jgi:O-antigen ligase/tetratricopeptide (TPR) repeat protein
MIQRIYSYLGALIALLLIPILWGNLQPRVMVFSLGLFVLTILAWSYFHYRQTDTFYIPKVMLPALSLVGYQGLIIFRAPVPVYGIDWIASTLAILLLFIYMVNTIRDRNVAQRWEIIFISIGIILVLTDVLYLLSWYLKWWGISSSIFQPPPMQMRSPGLLFGHPNFFAAYINLFIPIFLVRAFEARKYRRIGWSILGLLFLTSLFFTASRSAWLALGGSVLVMTTAIYFPLLTKIISKRRWIKTILNRNTALLVAAILVLGLAITPIFVIQIQATAHGSVSDRLSIWSHAIKLIAGSPILGHGPGSSPFLYVLRSEANGGDEVYHAHNVWLQILITGGIIGLAIVLWMVALIVRAFLSAWENTNSDEPRRFCLLAILGVGTALAIHGLLDYTFDPFIFTIGVFFILALLYYYAPSCEMFELKGKIALTVIAILVATCSGAMLYTMRGAFSYWNGLIITYTNGLPEAKNDLCKAAINHPEMTYYSFQCSLANAFVAYEQADSQALQSAATIQSNALDLDPYWYVHWANLASYEWQQGNHNLAMQHMNRAASMAPNMPFLWLNLAWMEEQSGDQAAAQKHYLTAICMNPWYRDYPFFQQTSPRSKALQSECPKEIDTLSNKPDQKYLWEGWQALQANDFVIAEEKLQLARTANPQSPLSYALLGLIHQKNGEIGMAWREVQTALFLDSGSARVFLTAAEIARDQGDEAQALEYISQAFTVLRNPMFSRRYYLVAYHSPNLSTDLSPYLLKIGLLPDIREPFLYLAESLRVEGNISASREIIQWVERNSFPPR